MAKRVKRSVSVDIPATDDSEGRTVKVRIDTNDTHEFALIMLSSCGNKAIPVWQHDPVSERTSGLLAVYSREANGLINIPERTISYSSNSPYVGRSYTPLPLVGEDSTRLDNDHVKARLIA